MLTLLLAASVAWSGIAEDCAAKREHIASLKSRIGRAMVSNCKPSEGLCLLIGNADLEGARPETVQLPTASDVETRLETQARVVDPALSDLKAAKKWYRENCPARVRSGISEAIRRVLPAR
jgi:hypothetical protein